MSYGVIELGLISILVGTLEGGLSLYLCISILFMSCFMCTCALELQLSCSSIISYNITSIAHANILTSTLFQT